MGHAIDYAINQGDTSIKYPGTSTSAFTDYDFYANCGKYNASGTIKQYGCAICALATFILHKGNLSATNDNIYYAVEQATIKGTNNAADFTHSSFTANIGNKSIYVTISETHDLAAAVSDGKICLARIENGSDSHYFLIDGMDMSASENFDKYLTCDPNGGIQATLSDVFARADIPANNNNITEKYILS